MKYSEAFTSNQDKLSDKWLGYLHVYDDLVNRIPDAKRILEIGVQNGGSLEVWNKIYPDAGLILGIDIDEKCSNLEFNSKNIVVFIGDVNSSTIVEKVKGQGPFHIIVDDGSHTSGDVISTFCQIWEALEVGGFYVVEDMHTSYWNSFGGGVNDTRSMMNFFQELTDVINAEAWPQGNYLETSFEALNNYGIEKEIWKFEDLVEINFYPSMCIMKKGKSARISPRVTSGNAALVYEGVSSSAGELLSNMAAGQSGTPIKTELEMKLEKLELDLLDTQDKLIEKIQIINEVQNRLLLIENSTIWKATRFLRDLISRLKQI